MLLFLLATFCLHDVTAVAKNEGIYQASSDWYPELSYAIIPDLSFCGWCFLFGVMPNPIDDLPFAVVIESGLLSSLSWRIHARFERGFNTRSWAIESFRQGIREYWDVVTRFRDIPQECDLTTSEFESAKIQVSL
jgi:hypothetical protein